METFSMLTFFLLRTEHRAIFFEWKLRAACLALSCCPLAFLVRRRQELLDLLAAGKKVRVVRVDAALLHADERPHELVGVSQLRVQ